MSENRRSRDAGNLLFAEGKFEEAVAEYRRALTESQLGIDERVDLLANLAVAQLKLGDAHGSAETCSSASLLASNERVLKTAVKAYQQLGDAAAVRDAKLALRAATSGGDAFAADGQRNGAARGAHANLSLIHI